MGNYELKFKTSVTKDLRSIPKQDIERILSRIHELTLNPRAEGCIKLTGQEVYRVRQGNYRIVYEIRESELIVLIIKVAHRQSVYR